MARAEPDAPPASDLPDPGRARPGFEILLVLGVSLGQSAVYSILSIIEKLTRNVAAQPADHLDERIGRPRPAVARPVLPDGRHRLPAGAGAAGALSAAAHRDRRRIGFDLRRLRRRPGLGIRRWPPASASPGLAFYFAARALGLNTNVAAGEPRPELVDGSRAGRPRRHERRPGRGRDVGFWFVRTRQLGWPLVGGGAEFSAVVRGSYHLYQGFGGFVGNLVMGLVFGIAYLRIPTRRPAGGRPRPPRPGRLRRLRAGRALRRLVLRRPSSEPLRSHAEARTSDAAGNFSARLAVP